MKLRLALIACLAAPAAQAADSKAESCSYQAQVVAAVQQARLDRVKERKVAETLAEGEHDWPENYNAAIPLIAPWVYEQKMKVIRNEDLAAAWEELCLAQ
jgi:hypothetical protein